VEFERLTIHNGSVRLDAIAAGPASGPLLILLHGFPEFSYSWRKQIGPLADAGFRVVAPDGRGYNESSKPPDIVSYSLPYLSTDVIAVADQLGREQFFLAGHDWGAAVAWHTAASYPNRVAKLVILNAPHPGLLIQSIRKRPTQLLRSWYMFFFQLPRIPEYLFSMRNFEGVAKGLVDASRPGAFSQADLEQYRQAWAKPGAPTGMINWYRRSVSPPSATSEQSDPCADPHPVGNSRPLCPA
jgi:pimeloyl-ACP methyl ester carboxylesterase